MGDPIHIIGGGLAGAEAAWQTARRGQACVLHEMRPLRTTPAHRTDRLAELVCSNSLKSETESTAPWLLKEELRRPGSLLLDVAARARVPDASPPRRPHHRRHQPLGALRSSRPPADESAMPHWGCGKRYCVRQ